MFSKTLTPEIKSTYREVLRSYKNMRKEARYMARELIKFATLYELLSGSCWIQTRDYSKRLVRTLGIRKSIDKYKLEILIDPKKQKDYKNIVFQIKYLTLHIVDKLPRIYLKDIKVKPLWFKNLEELERILKSFSWDDREKFLDFLDKKEGPMTNPLKSAVKSMRETSKMYEEIKTSFNAKKITTLPGISNDYDDPKKRGVIVLVDTLFDVHPIDTLFGFKLDYWSRDIESLILPVDRTYDPIELNEKTFRKIIEDYHFRLDYVINLIENIIPLVSMELKKKEPFNYLKLLEILNDLSSFLSSCKTTSKTNKSKELMIAKYLIKMHLDKIESQENTVLV